MERVAFLSTPDYNPEALRILGRNVLLSPILVRNYVQYREIKMKRETSVLSNTHKNILENTQLKLIIYYVFF